jgi:hypothetical protein
MTQEQTTHELTEGDVVELHEVHNAHGDDIVANKGRRGEVVQAKAEKVLVNFEGAGDGLANKHWLKPRWLQAVAPWDAPPKCPDCGERMTAHYGKGGDTARERRGFQCLDCNLTETWVRVQSEHADKGMSSPSKYGLTPEHTMTVAAIIDERFPMDSWHSVSQKSHTEAVVTVHGGDKDHAYIIRDAFSHRADTFVEIIQNDASVLKVRLRDERNSR